MRAQGGKRKGLARAGFGTGGGGVWHRKDSREQGAGEGGEGIERILQWVLPADRGPVGLSSWA